MAGYPYAWMAYALLVLVLCLTLPAGAVRAVAAAGGRRGAGSLPFTGLALGVVALLGLALALGGRHLRRRVAP